MKILVIEPYYGGSHKIFLNELKRHLPSFEFIFLTLPARKWKWRMRVAAPWVAELLPDKQHVDLILCSTFIDVATFRGLAPAWVTRIPILTYFHENQFAYPVQHKKTTEFQFGLTNYLSALASDSLAFNGSYNLATFLKGCRAVEKRAPDININLSERIQQKSRVLFPGMDFHDLDLLADPPSNAITTFLWNHRWEHDKNPEAFFGPFFKLHEKGVAFRLIIVGQSFQRYPDVFSKAQDELAGCMSHFGYVESRTEYLALIKQADVVVSTANHEFYGMSVIEAVRGGCRPLLPNRLSYPELFPSGYLYKSDADLYQRLRKLCCSSEHRLTMTDRQQLTDRFSWLRVIDGYKDWFLEHVSTE